MLRLRSLLAWSLVCAALLAPAGAAARQAQPASPPTAYLFVEIWTEVSGTGTLPALCIDFPGYQFEPSSGRMARFIEPLPVLRPSDLGFLGQGQSRTGAAGCGASSQLAPIASLPYTTTIELGTGATSGVQEETRAAIVVLRSVDQSGTLSATIDGADVTLPPGSRWQRAAGADVASAPFNGRYLVTSSVTNYGWNDRARIEGPAQFVWLPLIKLD